MRFSSPGPSPAWSPGRTVQGKCHIRHPPRKAARESPVGFDNTYLALVSKGADTVYNRELGNDQQRQIQQIFFL